jgi:hypothetical protein
VTRLPLDWGGSENSVRHSVTGAWWDYVDHIASHRGGSGALQ